MVLKATHVKEGIRLFATSWTSRINKTKYEGSADQICKQIVKECWNGRYFQTSTTNFKQFWTRDFGWCVNSLLKLGYEKEVHHSLRYAMNRFKENRKITTSITIKGKPFNFPLEAVDSLPWLIHAIKKSKFPYYSYKDFLNREINKYFKKMIDPDYGLVRTKHFSSMKDHSIRKSSCYDNCMVGLLAKNLKGMKLYNPFKKYDYPALIKQYFWNGNYFYDDLEKHEYVAGDANIFPFVCGLISDKEMMAKAIQSIQEAELDSPFPLKYTSSRDNVNFVWQEKFAKDYESNSIWMHMGPLYVKLVKQIDSQKATELKMKYRSHIEKHSNFLEVFSHTGKPYKNSFYHSDSGMLWAANYLTL